MDEPEIKIVDVFVCKLRKKLTSAGFETPIETVWGQGYVMPIDDDDQIPDGNATAPPGTDEAPVH